MTEKYIYDLLMMHDCVVVPGFGGFVLNQQPSRFAGQLHEIRPAAKTISFNRSLQVNDGLLVTAVSREENISYADALKKQQQEAEGWKNKIITNGQLNLEGLGQIILAGENRWVFRPETQSNFLKSSYGLSSLQVKVVEDKKIIFMQEEENETPENETSEEKSRGWVKATIAAVAVAAVGVAAFFAWNTGMLNQYIGNDQSASLGPDSFQEASADTAMTDTAMYMDQPVSEPVTTETASTANSNSSYYVIGGSFSRIANAKRFVKELKRKGYKAEMLDNENGHFRVSYIKDKDSLTADRHLQDIKAQEDQTAWLLKW